MWLEQTSNALCQINLAQSINLQYIFLSHIAVIYTVLVHWNATLRNDSVFPQNMLLLCFVYLVKRAIMRYTFRLGEMKVLERGFYCFYFFLPSLVMQLIVIEMLAEGVLDYMVFRGGFVNSKN